MTVTLLDPGWLDPQFVVWRQHEEEQFTRETGILVKDLPAPETAIDQLALWRKLLSNPAEAPDVFAIDVIWPAMMSEYTLDLTPYLGDTAGDFPALVANDTIHGKLIAFPYHADAGLLFYRTDLLREYGYRNPPRTWDELETMASRIQKGERAKGNGQFWGFVWQGAVSEALTCNALEWQASEGGGNIIEPDGTISVNNPEAARAWARASRWVDSISPPSVISYREWDSLNLWHAGNAAFMRNWPTSYSTSEGHRSLIRDRFAATLLPAGKAGQTGTLGGAGLSVFRGSHHPREAVALARFLVRKDVEAARIAQTAQPPVLPGIYDDASVAQLRPHFRELKQLLLSSVVVRPSTVSGKNYAAVSDAYARAVHSVLTKEEDAREATANLEKQIISITGMKPAEHRATK